MIKVEEILTDLVVKAAEITTSFLFLLLFNCSLTETIGGDTIKVKYMRETKEILEQFFNERNTSERTQETYLRCVKYFENTIQQPLPTLLNIAETEEENNITWKNSSLKRWLIQYRKWCYTTYKKSTAETYYIPIPTIFRHFEITVNRLPYFSTKQTLQPTPINPDLLVDRDILRLVINTNNPLLKAIVLLMSSSGISRSDALNLSRNDYEIAKSHQDPIPTWHITRQKTGVKYFTFSSPESTQAIDDYLLTRNDDDPRLFKINKRYLSHIFKQTNDILGLGKNGEFSRFSMHMLRRFHATQLIESGMSESKVDLLQGRKPSSIAYQSYIKIKPSKLRSEYMGALPFLVVEDVNRVKSELELTKDELESVSSENVELRNSLSEIYDRLERLELTKPY